MDSQTKEKCEIFLNKYFKYKTEKVKVKYRNKLFELLLPDFKKWITRILYAWEKFESEQQVISLSWECFEYCLLMYDTSYDSFLGRFFRSVRYYLLIKFAKEGTVRVPMEELQEILKMDNSPEAFAFERLLTLYKFRDCLPDDNARIVWDDAVMSLDDADMYKVRTKKNGRKYSTGMDNLSYSRLKTSFINIIKLILMVK